MKIPFKWEEITDFTYRAKVINGWIVQSADESEYSIVFIPDPNHEWEIG